MCPLKAAHIYAKYSLFVIDGNFLTYGEIANANDP